MLSQTRACAYRPRSATSAEAIVNHDSAIYKRKPRFSFAQGCKEALAAMLWEYRGASTEYQGEQALGNRASAFGFWLLAGVFFRRPPSGRAGFDFSTFPSADCHHAFALGTRSPELLLIQRNRMPITVFSEPVDTSRALAWKRNAIAPHRWPPTSPGLRYADRNR